MRIESFFAAVLTAVALTGCQCHAGKSHCKIFDTFHTSYRVLELIVNHEHTVESVDVVLVGIVLEWIGADGFSTLINVSTALLSSTRHNLSVVQDVENLDQKANSLRANAQEYNAASKKLKCAAWWQNCKWTIIMVCVIVLLIVIIVPVGIHIGKK